MRNKKVCPMPARMKKFYVTFGQAHPLRDHWNARVLVIEVIGRKWSMMYDEAKTQESLFEFFPGGRVGHILGEVK